MGLKVADTATEQSIEDFHFRENRYPCGCGDCEQRLDLPCGITGSFFRGRQELTLTMSLEVTECPAALPGGKCAVWSISVSIGKGSGQANHARL